NHLLNTRWPKSLRLGSVVEQVANDSDPIEPLFQALADQRPVNPEEVPTDADRTDPAVLTRTPFIFDARYGTRASTVVTVGHDGRVCFVERVWQWSSGGARCVGERRLQF
ncbi:MAG: hypothetical protein EBT33_19835, partial [Betaproteobacteria bacterium]|nr:hypothetical protein [Betaproteobacteria bacterium]